MYHSRTPLLETPVFFGGYNHFARTTLRELTECNHGLITSVISVIIYFNLTTVGYTLLRFIHGRNAVISVIIYLHLHLQVQVQDHPSHLHHLHQQRIRCENASFTDGYKPLETIPMLIPKLPVEVCVIWILGEWFNQPCLTHYLHSKHQNIIKIINFTNLSVCTFNYKTFN